MATTSTPVVSKPFTLMVYKWAFFTIVMLVSVFLMACTAFSAWLSYLSTPNILGYVLSHTIGNPHASVSGCANGLGNTMDSLGRAKLPKKMKVQIRDVRQGEPVGNFASTNEVEQFKMPERGRTFI
ncbi:hypothetical protein BDZ45DRAFT_741388 [Acephala macrosclerotiorum]|nr:hypothetical protein BDZ45DRAFT_741388 [Acephala macrosclerotiorum]